MHSRHSFHSVMLALTATAPAKIIANLKTNLCLSSSCKIIKALPNRRNVFLDVSRRLSNNVGYKSHEYILLPIAKNLNKLRECYPMTIIYMK